MHCQKMKTIAKFDAYSPWQDCDSGQQMLVWSDWSFGQAAAHLWKKTRDQQMPVTIRIDQITHTDTHTHTVWLHTHKSILVFPVLMIYPKGLDTLIWRWSCSVSRQKAPKHPLRCVCEPRGSSYASSWVFVWAVRRLSHIFLAVSVRQEELSHRPSWLSMNIQFSPSF